MPSAVNKESVNDRAKLIMHRLIARRLARDPALVERARDFVRRRLAEGGRWIAPRSGTASSAAAQRTSGGPS
ncbi:hypothetical protein [Dankookia sp. P2]|uniref:hypothetical protein n=1 Tax=Dankookia sp. P2 TaxID=3423955 RepID=UPI003D67E1E7